MNLTLKQTIQRTQESLYIYHDTRPDGQVMMMESETFSRPDGIKAQMTPIFWEDYAYAHFEKTKQEFKKKGPFSIEEENYSSISKDENIDFKSKLDYYELHKKLDDLAKTYGISVKSISQNSDSVFKEIPSLNKDTENQMILIESFGSKIKLGINGSKDVDNNFTVSVIKNNITKELPLNNAVQFLDDLQRNVIKMHEENINSIAFVAKKKLIGDGDSIDNVDDQFVIPHHETLKISGKSIIHETYLFNSSSKNGYRVANTSK